MKVGGIHIAALPQADGVNKLRPVAVLAQFRKHGDFLVCGISTQLQSADPDIDVVVDEGADDFRDTGLRQTSVLRLSHLFTIPKDRFRGRIGFLTEQRIHHLRQRLARFLG